MKKKKVKEVKKVKRAKEVYLFSFIIKHLIRSTENKLLRPDWTQPSPSYELVRLKTALTNHESVSVALAFEQTRHHILHAIFDERNEINRVGPRSFEDYLFGIDTL